jgi:hypothetical protein
MKRDKYRVECSDGRVEYKYAWNTARRYPITMIKQCRGLGEFFELKSETVEKEGRYTFLGGKQEWLSNKGYVLIFTITKEC